MNKLKRIFLLVASIGQVLAIILLFINIKAAIVFYVGYAVLMIGIFVILLLERKKEKEEDDRNDYRNY
ncbi:hypothetical protein J2Z40_001604 [Cytobacillus eiseniae]|uniref:Uncharacterized protein n=1 Tax=Cytobacillus eiseniae TaxID=762947 RepID=A0ABS4RDR4_9BACI|nr:hypothetical protein [Cytobacillus eiseniae]MBP2241042.1 hypothetical protein [Cytobacillus eiseniae]